MQTLDLGGQNGYRILVPFPETLEIQFLGAVGLAWYRLGEDTACGQNDDITLTIAKKLFWAGEATHPLQWATCGGGLLSGIDAAKAVASMLKS